MGSFALLITSLLVVWTVLSREPPVVHALDSGVAKLPGEHLNIAWAYTLTQCVLTQFCVSARVQQ